MESNRLDVRAIGGPITDRVRVVLLTHALSSDRNGSSWGPLSLGPFDTAGVAVERSVRVFKVHMYLFADRDITMS